MKKITERLLIALLSVMVGVACVSTPSDNTYAIERISYQGASLRFDQMIEQLLENSAVLIGEQHTRMDHHLTQLAILKAMHQRHPNLAVGVEWFQQPFQPVLDAFIAGRINEVEMLRQTEYYERWRYDYRLYRPIMAYARQHRIPVIALNAPVELTSQIGEQGLASLSEAQRQQLPAVIHPPSEAYRQQLQAIFAHHHLPANRIEHFITVQRVWDETMAANSVKYLNAHPESKMIVMAGVGHIAHDDGIAQDMKRASPSLELSRIASIDQQAIDDALPIKAEYLIESTAIALPATGKMGVMLNTDAEHLLVSEIKPGGAADKSGLQVGDRILSVDGKAIANMTDLKLAIGTASVGQEIELVISRAGQTVELDMALK